MTTATQLEYCNSAILLLEKATCSIAYRRNIKQEGATPSECATTGGVQRSVQPSSLGLDNI